MAVKAISYKNWCTENISPQSWVRIVLKSTDIIRSEGFKIKEIEEPEQDLELSDAIYNSLSEALEQLYEMKAQENLINSF